MEIGRQFDDASSLITFKTYHDTSCQTIRITQFCIGYDGIVVSYSDFHGLTSQIPSVVSLNSRSKAAQRKHRCSYQ